MIPTKYAVRNLRARWVTTAMTALGTGLVVWASVLSFGLADGLERALMVSVDPLDLVCLRRGSLDEASSVIEQPTANLVATLEGIARDPGGQPQCSEEFVTTLMKPRRGDNGTTNLIVRGVKPMAQHLRPGFRIVAGHDLEPGKNQAITSPRIGERFENTRVGEKLTINNVEFAIVGHFEASGCAAESEVWTDLRDLTAVRKAQNVVSSICLRLRDEAARKPVTQRLRDDEQFNLKVMTEDEFFREQMLSAQAIRVIGLFIAVFLTVGAMFAAANTMYAAVAGRTREIATLRALGFSRFSILCSFLLEAVVLCSLGGVIGCLAVLPFHGLTTGMANFQTFSEIAFSFQFGPKVLALGLGLALSMGAIGGMFPAIRAVRLDIIRALREL